MHAQSASRISGRTRTAVSAMCVRALRITVLKSAGSFTRDECHDLNAEKIQRVKCFMFTRCGICCGWQFSNAGAAGRVRKFLAMVNWRKWQFTCHVRFTPGSGHCALDQLCPKRAKSGSQSACVFKPGMSPPNARPGPPSPPSLHHEFPGNWKRLRQWSGKSISRQPATTVQIFSACLLRDL
jgi:hypothetical protein